MEKKSKKEKGNDKAMINLRDYGDEMRKEDSEGVRIEVLRQTLQNILTYYY